MRVAMIAGVAGVMALVGCQTKPIEEMSYTEMNALAGVIAKRCLDQGVPAGGAEMDACLRQEVRREQYTRASNRQKIRQFANDLGDIGDTMQANAAAAQANRPINCTSTVGKTFVGQPSRVNTTCY